MAAMPFLAHAQQTAGRDPLLGPRAPSRLATVNQEGRAVAGGAGLSASQSTGRRDSVLNGVLIGAGVGGLLGLIPDHYDDCEECHDSLYASIAVGAGVGLLIDLLRNGGQAASPSEATGLRLRVALGRRTVGLGGKIVWR
jgi:hypothetical protein